MAAIDLTSGSASAYGAGELQLQNKVQMTATLTSVTDNLNVASPLKLSTSLVQTTSTLKITTSDVAYIDAEDNSGNNRFTVSRAVASQLVTVDFASLPTALTTPVGAIRTATDGTTLANVMTFLENGNIGMGTDTPTGTYGKLTVQGTGITLGADGLGKIEIGRYSSGVPNSYIKLGSNSDSLRITNSADQYDIVVIENNTTGEKLRLTQAGNVGIGTAVSSWDGTFIALQIGLGTTIYNNSAVNGSFFGSNYFYNGTNNIYKNTGTATAYGQVNGAHTFFTAPSGTAGNAVTFTESVRIDANGIKFNGDTAAANALNDYEEGTWTPGITFGGASVGATYTVNTGTYTKIGRQVTVNGYIFLSSKGSSTGSAQITGLPFAIPNNNANYSAPSFRFSNITFSGQFVGYGDINSTNIDLNQVTLLGALTAITDTNFANNSSIIVTLTYFV